MINHPSCSKFVHSLIQLFTLIENSNLKEKKELLASYKHKKLLTKILKLVYDPHTKFNTTSIHIKNIKLSSKKKKGADKRLKSFFKILKQSGDQLHSKESVLVKLKALCNNMYEEEFQLYCRILDQELMLGITMGLVETVFPNLILYPTKFMRSGIYNNNISFPVLGEPNIPGIRVKFLISETDAKVYSTDYCTFNKFFDEHIKILQKLVKTKIKKPIELDAIVYNGKYSSTFKTFYECTDMNEHRPMDCDKLELHCFDFIIQGSENKPLIKRKRQLCKIVSILRKKIKTVGIVPNITIKDETEIEPYFDCYNSKFNMILKSPTSPYVYRRDSYWLKILGKKIPGVVVDILVNENRYSIDSMVVKLKTGKTIVMKTFYESHHSYFSKNKNKVIGKHCVVLHSEAGYKFHRLRKDKGNTNSTNR